MLVLIIFHITSACFTELTSLEPAKLTILATVSTKFLIKNYDANKLSISNQFAIATNTVSNIFNEFRLLSNNEKTAHLINKQWNIVIDSTVSTLTMLNIFMELSDEVVEFKGDLVKSEIHLPGLCKIDTVCYWKKKHWWKKKKKYCDQVKNIRDLNQHEVEMVTNALRNSISYNNLIS